MNPDQLFEFIVKEFQQRKSAAGIAVAFIDMLQALGVFGAGFASLDAVFVKYPRREELAGGRRANTLVVEVADGHTTSLRGFYNKVEDYFRNEMKRYGYPSNPGHATGRWRDYIPWVDGLVKLTPEQAAELREKIRAFVLEKIESQEFDPATVQREPARFRRILEEFDTTARAGEPTGAAYQGLVYGFMRADNQHLQVETRKVRTGSKRVGRVGDVDGWDGARLAVTAEVKQYKLPLKDVPALQDFAAQVAQRGAIGIVVALSFDEGVREAIEALGLIPLDTEDLVRIVSLWDPVKQRTAANAALYCFTQVEQNASLMKRLSAFLGAVERGEATPSDAEQAS